MSGPEYTSLPATDVDNITGDIFVPSNAQEDSNTLDEPISATLMRDIKAVGSKFYHVIVPRDGSLLLNDWDLWGPLIICTVLAVILHGHGSGSKHDGGPEFAQVFVIIWVGAGVVTLNSKLLDGQLSFFQSICVLGYCVFPLAVGAVLIKLFALFGLKKGLAAFIVDFIIVTLGFVWAMFAAVCFLKPTNNPGKKFISTYPVGLFYFVIAWIVVSQP